MQIVRLGSFIGIDCIKFKSLRFNTLHIVLLQTVIIIDNLYLKQIYVHFTSYLSSQTVQDL